MGNLLDALHEEDHLMQLAQSDDNTAPGPGASSLAPDHWRVVDSLLTRAWSSVLRGLAPGAGALPAEEPESSAVAKACGIFSARDGAPVQCLVDHITALRSGMMRPVEGGSTGQTPAIDSAALDVLVDRTVAEAVRGFVGELDRERNQRLRRLGHDFRAHLNVLTMVGEALNGQQAAPQLPSYAAMIQRSSDELKSLLDELQDSTQVSGLHRDVPSCNIASACWEMADKLRAQHGIRLDWTGPSLVRGHFDSALVCEALANLIHITAAPEQDNRSVRVEVEQSGPHIAWVVRGDMQAARQDHPGAAAPDSHDAMLRLIAAHQIARMHGGRLQSTADMSGRSFRMELPVAPLA